jgi:hypothetical protein
VVPIAPEAARQAVDDLSGDEVAARLHFRIGADALRRGDGDVARRQMARAGARAPFDWTVRRAAMPLVGQDPFGEEFLTLYEEWKAQACPITACRPPRPWGPWLGRWDRRRPRGASSGVRPWVDHRREWPCVGDAVRCAAG